jgi:hypothetical protein
MRLTDDRWASNEDWWIFRKSDGELLAIVPMKRADESSPVVRSVAAREILGTPLTLVQWYCIDQRQDLLGTRYEIYDASWNRVWELDRPREYMLPGNGKGHLPLEQVDTWESRSITTTSPRRFRLLFPADRVRATFEVTPAEEAVGSWRVREVERVADS